MIKKVIFICIGLCFIMASVSAQIQKDTIVASQYYKEADSLLKGRKFEESMTFFKKAISVYKKAETWEKVANCYNKISEIHRLNLSYKKSLKAADNALLIINLEKTEKNKKEQAIAYYNKAHCFLKFNEFDEAIIYFKKALQIQNSQLIDQDSSIIDTYVYLARCYYILGNYTSSLQYLEKALSITIKKYGKQHYEVARIYNNMGTIHETNEDYNEAIKLYEKSLSMILKSNENDTKKKKILVGALHQNIGIIQVDKGNYDKALTSFKKSLQIYLEIFSENHPKVLNVYSSIGISYGNIGQYNLALEYLMKVIDGMLQRPTNDILNLAFSYSNISSVYQSKKEYKTALEYLFKAEKIWLEHRFSDYHGLSRCYINIGSTLNLTNRYDEAITYLKKALVIADKQLKKNHKDLGLIYLGLGNSYYLKKEYKTALDYFKKSKENYSKINIKWHSDLAKCYVLIGDIKKVEGDYQKALEYYHNAIRANHTEFDEISIYKNPGASGHISINVQIMSLLSKAILLKELYGIDKDIILLKTSLSTYTSLDQLIDENRDVILTYEDKIQFSEKVSEVYEKAIQTELLMASVEKNKLHIEKAFYYLEKKKANVLKEFITTIEIKKHLDIPSDIISLEDKIKADQSYYKSKIIESTNPDSLSIANRARYKDELFRVNRKHDSLTSILQEQYQSYYQLKHQNSIVSIEEIQKNLKENSTLIEFFTTDSVTYVFTIFKNNFSVQELETDDLEDSIKKLRDAIITNDINEYKNIGHTLYNKLITPIKDKLLGDKLIIIPDGPLWHLNFDLLLTQNNEAEARNMPYLLRDYAISYANSANLLFNPLQRTSKSSEIRNECLAFSFSDSTQLISSETMSLATLRDTGDDLPGTRKEIKAISTIVNGQYFYGSEAIEANFKQNAGQYGILHLALHGDVDHKNPQNSKLYFTKSKDTIEDNLLYSHELFALDIPAELAVLSACNTGTGAIAKGEGIMSLGNAFQYAGTKSLLLSGWEVSDKSAPVLIENFYTNLANGMNKAKALQKAKLDFIKTTDFDQVAPFYWGSFYLLGNADPIDIDQPIAINWYWMVLLCVLIVLALVFMYYKKRLK